MSDSLRENSVKKDASSTPAQQSGSAGGGVFPLIVGVCLAAGFYAIVAVASWQPLNRYFLGHPISVAATVLFWMGAAILLVKWWRVNQQWIHLETIRDQDLKPAPVKQGPASEWLGDNHAGFVAKNWLATLGGLPFSTRASQLVARLEELLTRQSQRGTSKHLADDLRELSARDADAAHDSLGLVRIIVWAIPMLGFLGTVIGITQTLGGLDFTDGTAAVDNLKSGLYVAFDTTALGLVLSVVAIFIQFPIEQSEQRLLATIDHRIGHLVSACLPSDDTADNEVALIANLCDGIKAAVAESLAAQAELWRQTIDEAHSQWQVVQEENANRITEAFQHTLAPALRSHATVMTEAAINTSKTMEEQSQRWQETMTVNAAALASHHQKMIKQCDQIVQANRHSLVSNERLSEVAAQTKAVAVLQHSLDANLQRLEITNRDIERSIAASAGDGMTDAMRTLARAVDVLSRRVPEPSTTRRAA